MTKFRAIIFDLDGTIVDSKLDFDKMRDDIGIKNGSPILEYLDTIDDELELMKAFDIVNEHELKGAQESTLIHDFLDFYQYLKQLQIPIGILTRNSKDVTNLTLDKHNLAFDDVLTRDCCKAKPNPDGLNILSQKWEISPESILYIGDFKLDIETAHKAKMKSALILNNKNSEFASMADYTFNLFEELKPLL